ncbi:MAG TPA: tetratricopeptide repeat protein [Candidatus Paceibacterota bacterium]|nr:tetratricopeptide repeat protein [Candidatus Paceibacterota bacterium]
MRLDKISFVVLQVVLFFAPVFFIPSLSVPFQTGKSSVILYGIVLALALWLVARLKDGVFSIPKTWLYAAAGILAVVYAVAALVSGNHGASLSGQGFELGTLAFFLPSLVLFLLVPLVTRSEKEVFYSYTTLIASFLVVGLFHLARFVGGPGVLSFGIFTAPTANLLGNWNDVAIFFGLASVFSFVTLEKATLSRLFKVLVYAVYVIALAMLVVVNFMPVWISLAALALVFFIYELSFGKRQSAAANLGARVPYHALVVLVISVIFIFFGARVSGIIANSLGTSQVEVRPSWTATLEVAKSVVKTDPVFGVGPNRFASQWVSHKPAGINGTLFWNTDFNYGIGLVPSMAVTAGILGFLAMAFFVGLFLWTAIKALLRESASPFSRYLVLSSLFSSVFLWIFSIVYVPSAAIWILTMAVSGLFIASLREDKALGVASATVLNKPAASFVSVLVTVLALIGAISFAYFVTVKLAANVYFQKGVAVINGKGDLDAGEKNISNAVALSPSDTYQQALAELNLVRLNNLFNDKTISQSDAQAKFQTLLGGAITAAQAAVALNPTNYQNQMELGRVFEAVVPLNIEGAYENAKKAYQAALALNPENPQIYLIMARLEVAHKDTKAAKDYIAQALQKKSDYADAIFLLSQIQISENDVDNAIQSVSAVATLSPQDPGIFFQLGILLYSKKDYANAQLAFERAVSLNPQYANAKYFLGLAYYLTGAADKSLQQFKDLLATNPDNADVKAAIASLEAGKSPVPAPAAPVKASTLPVKQ